MYLYFPLSSRKIHLFKWFFNNIREFLTRQARPKIGVNLIPCRPLGQHDLLVLAAPAGGLHLPELQQQLPDTSVGGVCLWGFLCSLPVQNVEHGGSATVGAVEPGAAEAAAAHQQQSAALDPPQLRTTEIRGLYRWVKHTETRTWWNRQRNRSLWNTCSRYLITIITWGNVLRATVLLSALLVVMFTHRN